MAVFRVTGLDKRKEGKDEEEKKKPPLWASGEMQRVPKGSTKKAKSRWHTRRDMPQEIRTWNNKPSRRRKEKSLKETQTHVGAAGKHDVIRRTEYNRCGPILSVHLTSAKSRFPFVRIACTRAAWYYKRQMQDMMLKVQLYLTCTTYAVQTKCACITTNISNKNGMRQLPKQRQEENRRGRRHADGNESSLPASLYLYL